MWETNPCREQELKLHNRTKGNELRQNYLTVFALVPSGVDWCYLGCPNRKSKGNFLEAPSVPLVASSSGDAGSKLLTLPLIPCATVEKSFRNFIYSNLPIDYSYFLLYMQDAVVPRPLTGPPKGKKKKNWQIKKESHNLKHSEDPPPFFFFFCRFGFSPLTLSSKKRIGSFHGVAKPYLSPSTSWLFNIT